MINSLLFVFVFIFVVAFSVANLLYFSWFIWDVRKQMRILLERIDNNGRRKRRK